nr:phosphatase PAP2 family protein [Roseateles oligotrophus]
MPDLAQLRRWELRMAAAVGLAGLCFLVWPVESGYAPADPGGWQALAHLAGWVSGRFNLLPSLHVALSLLTLQAVWPWAGRWQRLALGLWFAALLASVLLTHQHHVADVVAGLLLAVGLSRYIAPPPASRAELISPHAKSSSSKITRYQKD